MSTRRGPRRHLRRVRRAILGEPSLADPPELAGVHAPRYPRSINERRNNRGKENADEEQHMFTKASLTSRSRSTSLPVFAGRVCAVVHIWRRATPTPSSSRSGRSRICSGSPCLRRSHRSGLVDEHTRRRGTWYSSASNEIHVHKCTDIQVARCHRSLMFRLIVSVRRGSACNMPDTWQRYPTLEKARMAAAALLRHERVTRIAVVRNEAPPVFVEWLDR